MLWALQGLLQLSAAAPGIPLSSAGQLTLPRDQHALGRPGKGDLDGAGGDTPGLVQGEKPS